MHGRYARQRRGLILVVVLVMVALLSLLAAAYTFLVRANLSAVMAHHYEFQARMAADSGLQRAVVALRESRGDTDSWFNNPEQFWGFPVYGQLGIEELGKRTMGTSYDPHAPAVWRYSLMSPNYDTRNSVRYGVTDEGSRLNLNSASEAQLRRLFTAAIPIDLMDNPVDINILVDSLLDWREPSGGGGRGGGQGSSGPRPNGAKDEYYLTLNPPYRAKGAPFSTVEELLLVRGFTGWVVFGEDYNRNGLLDSNEDDGDVSFPPDNGDGKLYPGVSPFLTVWSRETNMSSAMQPRISLNSRDLQKLQEDMTAAGFNGDIINYVATVRGSGKAFNSVMNLFPAPPPPETEPETEEEPPPEEEDPATTQPGEEESTTQPTSQPMGGKGEERRAGSTDQSGSRGGSENNRATSQPVYTDLTPEPPPGTIEDLPLILDRLTVQPTPVIQGRININTAPREVLLTIDGLSEDDVNAIVAARPEVPSADRATPAWLLSQNVIDLYKFRRILDKITTSSSVFRAEAVGYADNVGVIQRVNVVWEMRGPIPQVIYKRNLTGLGPAYNPYGEEIRGITD